MLRKYGWRPDLPDLRDYKFSIFRQNLPKKVDLSLKCSPIENQESLGSCTANAIVGALEYNDFKDDSQWVDLSRLFIYYNEREIEGTINYDAGALIRDGIKSLVKFGVCSENLLPYDINRFIEKPTEECYEDAKKRTIIEYMRITGLQSMKKCLADGFPFIFGFSVYESFEGEEVAKTGKGSLPNKDERLVGGHAVLAVGYDDITKDFLIRNSWGIEWGRKGYFTLPYKYLSNPYLANDFWTIRK